MLARMCSTAQLLRLSEPTVQRSKCNAGRNAGQRVLRKSGLRCRKRFRDSSRLCMLYIAGILLFLILMKSSRLKELLQTCCRLYYFDLLSGRSGVLCSTSSANPHERRQEGLKPQTRYIQYFDKGMDRFVSAVLARNLHSFVQTLQAKNKLTNEIDIKCFTWGARICACSMEKQMVACSGFSLIWHRRNQLLAG